MELEQRFCSQPFEYFELGRSAGDKILSHVCCPSWLPDVVGDMAQQSLSEVWNGDKLQKIRQSIHDGSFKYCNKDLCPLITSGQLPLKNEVQDPYLKQIIENQWVQLPKGPRKLNLSNDRSCNLSCPSCRTQKIMLISGPEYEHRKRVHEDLIEEALPDLNELVVCSTGDPFASRMHREMLQSIDGQAYPHLEISIVTNGQLFSPKMWDSLHKIHNNIKYVNVSVDAARAETYRVVRRGDELENLIPNLEFLAQRKKEGFFKHYQLDFVVQDHNFREMAEFVQMGKAIGVDCVYFQRIVNWNTFSNEDFDQRAIYLESHPDHQEFVRHLQDPLFDDPIVDLGNCTPFREAHV